MRHAVKLFGAVATVACNMSASAPSDTATVVARVETQPIRTADRADDPAIWRNPINPAASLIVATDKRAGLYVYGLDGRVRYFVPGGGLNNVDLVDRGRSGILVVASDRSSKATARLQLYRLDPRTAHLTALGAIPGGSGEAYGVCLWQARDALYAFSVLKEGAVNQVAIDLAGTQPTGGIVRRLKLSSATEGCIVDPRTAILYVGEEDVGIWRFDARRQAARAGELVARVDGSHLVADVEGLALMPDGRHRGFLVASSQGDNAFALFRLPDMSPAGRFRVVSGSVDGAEETDGIDLVPGPFGRNFGAGLLVVHDGRNEEAQNFKLIAWQDVLEALKSQ